VKRTWLSIILLFGLLLPINQPANADVLTVSQDQLTGYNRSLFKHWIDADKDGCDTRAEVLIEEAIVKPKVGKKCVLTGGKWRSEYDGRTTSKASDLDIDHVVPLAEAWRSGAWAWTPTQRQAFANDLSESGALVAVSLGQNRSKGDKDVSDWLPSKGVCGYVYNWITVKIKYSLTADSKEMSTLDSYISSCNLSEFKPVSTVTPVPTTTPLATPTPTPTAAIKFKMPFILGDGKLGAALGKWPVYGFVNQPIISQRPSSVKDYSCYPISNDDWIFDVLPKWDTLVDKNTQVTIITSCTLDLKSSKPTPTQLPTPSPLPSPSVTSVPIPTVMPTPTPTVTSVPVPTPTPTPTVTSVPLPMPTPTPTPSPTPTKVKPAPVKYKNCTEAKAAGVTPIRRATDPELYALNTALDGDKDGDACEN
jgi:hypothetical protein